MNLICSENTAGFFSCCSVRLHNLIVFFNNYKELPNIFDTSTYYSWYKYPFEETKDITFKYFKHYDDINIDIKYIHKIDYHECFQFKNYKTLDLVSLNQFICKYFTPNDEILKIQSEIENKYSIDYNNICVLFYRGNDKITEIELPSFDEYISHANEILKKEPNIKFLIQSDETDFLDRMKNEFPNNIIFYDEIRHMSKQLSTVDIVYKDLNYDYSLKYLAITIIMSKCKYIICNTGNCSIWIILYRNNTNNVMQLSINDDLALKYYIFK
jgi:hypothetical protein